MGDGTARTDDLHVPGLERQPLSVVAVVVFYRILEHESSDLEAAVRVFARKGDGVPFLFLSLSNAPVFWSRAFNRCMDMIKIFRCNMS